MPEFYHDPDAPVQPDQYAAEFEAILQDYKQQRPRNVLEIGSREGGSLYQWMKHAPEGARIVSLDMPGPGRWGTHERVNHDEWHKWARVFNLEDFDCVLGDSHQRQSREAVKEKMPRGIDWLFIDGDHTTDGVLQDLFDYGLLVNKGGTVVLHDILPDESDHKIGVWQVWPELRGAMVSGEYISDNTQTSRGIGWLKV